MQKNISDNFFLKLGVVTPLSLWPSPHSIIKLRRVFGNLAKMR